MVIPPTESQETVQNNPFEFMQEFEPNEDINIPHDVPTNPMQDYEGATPNNSVLPDAGTSSLGRQRKFQGQWLSPCLNGIFMAIATCTTWPPQGFLTDKPKQTSFTICIKNFKNT